MENQEFDKAKSVAFTGHRFIRENNAKQTEKLLRAEIVSLYNKGYRYFYCGMAIGFDLLAAEIVLELKKTLCKQIKLVAAVPFRNQTERYSDENKARYEAIIKKASKVYVLQEKYTYGCLLKRNDFMLRHVSYVIAYLDRTEQGGTFYTCRRAIDRGIAAKNLFRPDLNRLFFPKMPK